MALGTDKYKNKSNSQCLTFNKLPSSHTIVYSLILFILTDVPLSPNPSLVDTPGAMTVVFALKAIRVGVATSDRKSFVNSCTSHTLDASTWEYITRIAKATHKQSDEPVAPDESRALHTRRNKSTKLDKRLLFTHNLNLSGYMAKAQRIYSFMFVEFV